MKYLVSCSFGKDSLATVILAKAYGLPIDAVVYARIMFDKNISAEPPEHEAFIHNVAIPTLEKWGIKTIIVDSPVTFQDCFFRVRCRGANKGKFVGFPIPGRCDVLRDCKLPAIEKARALFKDEEVTWYLGIASDETIRLQRLKDNQISLLAKFGYTEKMAAYLCQWYGLYSPHYRIAKRGGCFFCPNQREKELRHLKYNSPHLWQRLLEMSATPNKCSERFNRDYSLEELDRKL